MRRVRLYLDTSPIIMIEPDQNPRRQAITKEFFRIVTENTDEYELLLSRVTIDELNAGAEEKRDFSLAFLETITYTALPKNDVAENLAWLYTVEGVLSQKHLDDLTHVAYATVSQCDYVLTWNMRHLANERTVRRVNVVNALENYGKIFIATPEFFTGGKIYGK